MSLEYRMDSRTREAFQTDIQQFTEKEFYWGIALRYDFCERGMPCRVEEHGVDNSGRLIPGRLPNYNADKKYHFDGDDMPVYIEIKTIPEWSPWFTFKVSSLESCLEQVAQIVIPRRTHYHMLDDTGITHLLKNFPIRTDIEDFGCKPCIRVRPDTIEQMIADGLITNTPWMPTAKAYVEQMGSTLFADRKTKLVG